MYIGQQPVVGRYILLDQISGGFNGTTSGFTMSTAGGVQGVVPGLAQNVLLSLGGVIQQPGVDYTISGSGLTFTTPPVSGTTFFATVLGDAQSVGTPSDGTVTPASIASGYNFAFPNLTVTGVATIASGSASAPSLSITGDSNTGLYSPGADQLALATNSSERIRIGTNGEIGLAGANYGTSGQVLTSAGSGAAPTWTTPSAGNTDKISEGNSSAEVIDTGSDGRFVVTTEGSERLRVDSSGRLGVGTASPGATLDVSETSSGATVTSLYLRNPAALAAGTVSRLAMTAVNTGSRFAYIDAGVTGASDNGHYLAFGTNPAGGAPTEKMRLTTDGRLGIGTTSPSKTLHVALTASNSYVDLLKLTNSGVGSATQAGLVLSTGDGISTGAGDIARIKALDVGGYKSALTFETSQRSAWGETTTEACRIDSSGRLLVGTSTTLGNGDSIQIVSDNTNCLGVFSGRNDIYGPRIDFAKARGTTASPAAVLTDDRLGQLLFYGYFGGYVEAAAIEAQVDGTPGTNDMPGRLVFRTTADGASGPTERMRITQNGKIYMGQTSGFGFSSTTLEVEGTNAATFKATGAATTQAVYTWHNATTGNNLFVEFGTEASPTTRGSIDYNRSAGQVRYNVTSDRRLKSEIADSNSALSSIEAIKVRSYTWSETGYKVPYGFIAQELNEIAPDAVKVGDDGDEITNTWAVDSGKLVPLLTKALQETLAKIETLEAKVAALEAS